jgi:hypothetical protein
MSLRSKYRRSQRTRQGSIHSGQGHGKRTYVPVQRTNRMITEAERTRRRLVLWERDERTEEYLRSLRKRIAKREAEGK